MMRGQLFPWGGMFPLDGFEKEAAQTQERLRAARAQGLIPPSRRQVAAKPAAASARTAAALLSAPKARPLPWMTAAISLAGNIGGPGGWITAAGVAEELARARAGNARAVLV